MFKKSIFSMGLMALSSVAIAATDFTTTVDAVTDEITGLVTTFGVIFGVGITLFMIVLGSMTILRWARKMFNVST